jgi:hypothetical protein
MLDGIKLLIERMDSNPEEFFGDLAYRWADVMQDIAKNGPQFLEEEDLMLLNKKVKEVRRKELNAKIMDEIANAERLSTAQEKFTRAGKVLVGAAQAKQQGSPIQKAWWAGAGVQTLQQSFDSAYSDYRAEHGNTITNLEWAEQTTDRVTINRIRAENHALEMQLAAVKQAQAAKDAKAQAYKKRNNQGWFR